MASCGAGGKTAHLIEEPHVTSQVQIQHALITKAQLARPLRHGVRRWSGWDAAQGRHESPHKKGMVTLRVMCRVFPPGKVKFVGAVGPAS